MMKKQSYLRLQVASVLRRYYACGLVLLAWCANAQEPRAGSARPALLTDNFAGTRLNAQNWIFGNHPNNHSLVQNGVLALRSEGKTSGWIYTREKFTLRERSVEIKMVQPNGDGALGISPTVTNASAIGFSSEQNYYRLYTSRDETSGPFRLYVQWSKAGVVDGLEVAPEIAVTPNSYLRLLTQGEVINFQYSADGNTWQTVYAEVFALPGFTLDDRFHIEISAGYTQRNGEWLVDDFALRMNHETTSNTATTVAQVVLRDALRERTLATRTGGRFVAEGGWQAVNREDMLVYDLGRYISAGVLEVTVRNCFPPTQNTFERHHFLAMFRNPWGNHHSVETQENFWDMHTGSMYSPGTKLQSSFNYADEKATIIKNTWKKEETYVLRLEWRGKELQYFRNGALQARHTHDGPLQLRYLFLGRDYTVSGDLVTNFKGNQYPAFIGPIFSNVQVQALVAAEDRTAPRFASIVAASLYANAARLQWRTDEPATCMIEYGLTSSYGQQTPALNPPEQSGEATLSHLAPNQTYHYRIVAIDDAGNRTASADGTFTTMKGGLYLFPPSADTFVEKNYIYGELRSHGNFGWTNLLASDGRACYLRFEVAGLNGEVAHAALRLHGRQTGKGGGKLRALQAPWEESAVTWLTKPEAGETDLGYIDAVRSGEWAGVALREIITGNGSYDFALLGAGETVSFDSRESTNHQPELIVALREKESNAPQLTNLAVAELSATSATLTWSTNEPATTELTYNASGASERIVADSSDFSFAHRLTLRQLLPYKKYRCQIRARDAAGNSSSIGELQFETLPARLEQVARHEIFEANFNATQPSATARRNGADVTVTFTGTAGAANGQSFVVPGFGDGKNVYLVRFAPPATGTWSWKSQSSDASMHGQSGTLTCAGKLPDTHSATHGPLQNAKLYPATLAYADSTPFFLLGVQLPAAPEISFENFQKYIDARAELACNFVLLTLSPPEASTRSAALNAGDEEQLQNEYWRRLDERVAYANTHGMVVGLNIFPRTGGVQFSNAELAQRYVRYVVRRYAASNTMWLLEELPEHAVLPRGEVLELIRANDPYEHVVLERDATAPEPAFIAVPVRNTEERRFRAQILTVTDSQEAALVLRQRAWEGALRGQGCILAEALPAAFNEESLYPPALRELQTLHDFWASDIHHAVPWWKFTEFIRLDNARWLASAPAEAYVIYSSAHKDFKIDLSHLQGEVRGEWFNTSTGKWSTAFSGPASRNFALKPPGEGFAAFLWLYRN